MTRSTVSDRFWSKVEKAEDCWLWAAACNQEGYGRFRVEGKVVAAHRWAYAFANGSAIPDEARVDHACHTPSCVNPSHLRLVTQKQNGENRGGLNANNTSGIRGVSWHTRYKAWQGSVRHNGKLITKSGFKTAAEAGVWAAEKRRELFTHNDADQVLA